MVLLPDRFLHDSDLRHICNFVIIIDYMRHLVTEMIHLREFRLPQQFLYTLFALYQVIAGLLWTLILGLVNE